MRFYTEQHKHYGGINLHTNKMYLCILNQEGETLQHQNRAEYKCLVQSPSGAEYET